MYYVYSLLYRVVRSIIDPHAWPCREAPPCSQRERPRPPHVHSSPPPAGARRARTSHRGARRRRRGAGRRRRHERRQCRAKVARDGAVRVTRDARADGVRRPVFRAEAPFEVAAGKRWRNERAPRSVDRTGKVASGLLHETAKVASGLLHCFRPSTKVASGLLPDPEVAFGLLPDPRSCFPGALDAHLSCKKEAHLSRKKGCCAESVTLEASRSVTLTCGAT